MPFWALPELNTQHPTCGQDAAWNIFHWKSQGKITATCTQRWYFAEVLQIKLLHFKPQASLQFFLLSSLVAQQQAKPFKSTQQKIADKRFIRLHFCFALGKLNIRLSDSPFVTCSFYLNRERYQSYKRVDRKDSSPFTLVQTEKFHWSICTANIHI